MRYEAAQSMMLKKWSWLKAWASANRDSVVLTRISARSSHDGPSEERAGSTFYQFNLKDAVPDDHLVRRIDVALDLSWLRQRTCPSLFVDGSPIGRSGTDDPNAGHGVCLCDPLGAADLP
jgi:hypothetical protein